MQSQNFDWLRDQHRLLVVLHMKSATFSNNFISCLFLIKQLFLLALVGYGLIIAVLLALLAIYIVSLPHIQRSWNNC